VAAARAFEQSRWHRRAGNLVGGLLFETFARTVQAAEGSTD
jgi:hypothetical protein